MWLPATGRLRRSLSCMSRRRARLTDACGAPGRDARDRVVARSTTSSGRPRVGPSSRPAGCCRCSAYDETWDYQERHPTRRRARVRDRAATSTCCVDAGPVSRRCSAARGSRASSRPGAGTASRCANRQRCLFVTPVPAANRASQRAGSVVCDAVDRSLPHDGCRNPGGASMALDPKLLEILACPEDKGPLLYFADEDTLYNPRLEAPVPRARRRHPRPADRRRRDRRRRASTPASPRRPRPTA